MAELDHLPPELEAAADADLGDPSLISADRMRAWIRERKRSARRDRAVESAPSP